MSGGPSWRRALLAGLSLGSLWACAHTGPPIEEEVLLKASASQRPEWIEAPTRSDDKDLYWAGRGAGSTVLGAVRAARRDAVSEALRFYYGPIIDRYFGVETDPNSMFMEDRDSNTSKETLNRAIERILGEPIEAASHAKVAQQYWEHYQIPTDDGEGRELIQAYAFVTMRRGSADEVVAHLLGESPTQIAIAGLTREAAFLVAEAKKQAKDGLAAGRSNRVPEMVTAHRRAGELMHDIDKAIERHQTLAGTPLQLDIHEARAAVASLDRLSRGVLASLRLSVEVDVYTGAKRRAPGLARLLAGVLNGLSIATAAPGERRCAPGHTHWMTATFEPPTCVRPEEGNVCDLALGLALGRCPSLEPVDTYNVDPSVLRGRGTSDRRAVLQAWAGIEAGNLPGLTREIRVLLAKHIPTYAAIRDSP